MPCPAHLALDVFTLADQLRTVEGKPRDEFLLALSTALVLNQNHCRARVVIEDLYFTDSDTEGLRCFAVDIEGGPIDRHGHRGWTQIMHHAVASDKVHHTRSWGMVTGQDQSTLQDSEITCRSKSFLDDAARLAHLIQATRQAQTLEEATPSAPAKPRPRLGL